MELYKIWSKNPCMLLVPVVVLKADFICVTKNVNIKSRMKASCLGNRMAKQVLMTLWMNPCYQKAVQTKCVTCPSTMEDFIRCDWPTTKFIAGKILSIFPRHFVCWLLPFIVGKLYVLPPIAKAKSIPTNDCVFASRNLIRMVFINIALAKSNTFL